MLLHFTLFALGLGILYVGAEWLVQGASSVAIRFGIRPMIVGLTIVALGTSMPEFLLNFFAILMGEDGLAVGNIVGSNISNLALILGTSALIAPLVVGKAALKREYPMMLVVTLLFWGLASDGLISRFDGVLLIVGLIGFMTFLLRDARRARRSVQDTAGTTNARTAVAHPSAADRNSADHRSGDRYSDEQTSDPASDEILAVSVDPLHTDNPDSIVGKVIHRFAGGRPHVIRVVLLIAGMAGLAVGARLMVTSAVEIARSLSISPIVIGLTIVAIGTSLPELAASLVCAIKDESDMSVGNILGSNMLNILFVVGIVALIRPMTVEAHSLRTHFPVMVAFSVLLLPLTIRGFHLSRVGGAIYLSGFAGYLIWLIYPYL